MALNDLQLGVSGSEILLSMFAREFTDRNIEIAREDRTVSGRLVKDVRAQKKGFTLSYEMISHADLEEIATLYALQAELSFIVTRPDFSEDTYTVLLKPFDRTRVKSVGAGYWGGVVLELEEV